MFKSFIKEFCNIYDIFIVGYGVFNILDEVIDYFNEFSLLFVIKVDGLVFGKGVIIVSMCEEVEIVIEEMFVGVFGDVGKKVFIEEFLVGEEVSFFVLMDGKFIFFLVFV